MGVIGFVVYQEFLAEDDTSAAPVTADEGETAEEQTEGETEAGADADVETGDGEDEVEGDVVDGSVAFSPSAPPAPPFMRAALTGKDLVLTGSLPSQELVDGVVRGATVAYAPFLQSELQVDPALPQEEWMAAAPIAAILAQTMTEGTVTLAEGRLLIEGRTATEDEVITLETLLTGATGLPVERGSIEITNLRPAIYILAGSDGQIALSGALPTEEIRSGLIAASSALYGADNVLDASTVDPGVDTALWMFNPEGLVGTLAQFPDYEVRLEGGAFSASLSGGSVFEPNSAEVTPEFQQVLNFGAVVLTRDPTMTIAVEGHTDSQGDDAFNLTLSQARADAVAQYLIGAGVQAERVTAIGKGETEPAAPNDTPEGRSRNRRVEFALTSDG